MERKEKSNTRKRLIQTIVFGGAGLLLAKTIYDVAESFKPTYVVNGNSDTMPVEVPVWQRPTDWKKK